MKNIVLSFDDGRKDFYTRAFPILKKYSFPATLNVITDYIGRDDILEFESGNHECISWDEVKECQEYGIEIANHSADHTNEIESIKRAVIALNENLGVGYYGFASPASYICHKNIDGYLPLLENNVVTYIRSGRQIKRDGFFYAALYVSAMKTKSSFLYDYVNRRNIIKADVGAIYPSVTCNADNNSKQVISFLKKLRDNSSVILMFHSILSLHDQGWGKDRWFNSEDELDDICRYLKNNNSFRVITNMELISV